MDAKHESIGFNSLAGLVGLPSVADPEDVIRASQERFDSLIQNAAHGDEQARREVLRLRLAYLNWAYAGERDAGVKSFADR